MEPIYREQHTISAIHTDRFGRAKLSTLLYFAQEAAGKHCSQLGVDQTFLAPHNLFWAVIRHKVQITRLPTIGQTITVETWPMPTTRSSFPRSAIAYDQEGNELFRSVSLWVLMDIASRAMVLPGKSGIALEGTVRGSELALPGSIPPAPLSNQVCRTVGFTQLDRNGHMNNTRYMDWIADLLPSAFHKTHTPKAFTICYNAEALEGQQIALNWQLLDGPCLQVDGLRTSTNDTDKKTRVFSAQVFF